MKRSGFKATIKGILCLSAFLLAIGCVWFGAKPNDRAQENEVVIVAELQTDDVYEVACEYAIDGVFCGGQGGSHADGSKLGQSLALRFETCDFPQNADLSTFSVTFLLQNATKTNQGIDLNNTFREMVPVEGTLAFPVAYGNVYRVLIAGSAEKGYKAHYLGADTERENGKQ